MASDNECDTDSTCSDASIGVGSASMREDLERVDKLLSFLKNYSPEKRKAGRPGKFSNLAAANTVNFDKVIKVMDAIYSLNVRMLSKLESLISANSKLKCDVDLIVEKQDTSPSYADVVSRSVSSPQGTSVERRSAAPRNDAGASRNGMVKSLDPSMLHFERRLDCVEQESLVKVMACHGGFIHSIVDSSIVTSAGKKVEALRNTDQLKKLFVDKVNELIDDTLCATDIETVDIVGRDKKHLRVSFLSKEARNRIIVAVKRKKPDDLFVNEYLTKSRAAIIFKLRTLRRNDETIERVYVRHGQVCVKTKKSDKISFINCESDLADLEASLVIPSA
jgi:hypothetical protein